MFTLLKPRNLTHTFKKIPLQYPFIHRFTTTTATNTLQPLRRLNYPTRLNHNLQISKRIRQQSLQLRHFSRQHPPKTSNSKVKNLFLKPLLFSTFIVTSSFTAVAVVDRLPIKLPRFLQDMNLSTPYLWPFIGTVILSNVIIFGCWNKSYLVPRFIERYFLCQHGIPHVFSTLGSTFSHSTPMHLGLNMFAFYGFGRACCNEIGSGDTAAMYVSIGVLSSWAAGIVNSYHPTYRVLRSPSLGASGAVLGLISYCTFARPNMEISLIFLPMFSLPAIQALGGLVLFDCVGLMLGWKALGHAAHLSGVACGAGFYFGGLSVMRMYEKEVRKKVDWAKRYYRRKLK
tara:strand:- start:5 stop:1033 length:1029 start_codon:yes stop_codon:yes gene_type:complete